MENIEELKKKYHDIWQKTMNEKTFLKLVRLKERQQKIKKEINKKIRNETYKKQKLIDEAKKIFADLILKHDDPKNINNVILKFPDAFIVKRKIRGKIKEINYAETLIEYVKQIKKM